MRHYLPSQARAFAVAVVLAGLCGALALPLAANAAETAGPPYDSRMLRLAEILGAMHHLERICPPKSDETAGKETTPAASPPATPAKPSAGDALARKGMDRQGRWRSLMSRLLAAEAPDRERRRRYIDRFNRGYSGFAQVYHQCTPSAELAIERYRREGAQLVREITSRYAR